MLLKGGELNILHFFDSFISVLRFLKKSSSSLLI